MEETWRWWQFRQNKLDYYFFRKLSSKKTCEIDELDCQIANLKVQNGKQGIALNFITETLETKDKAILKVIEIKSDIMIVHRTYLDYIQKKTAIRISIENCLCSGIDKMGHIDAEFSAEKMYIEDIQIYSECGCGSILMQELIDEAKHLGIKTIIGDLSIVDLDDHKERLLHFYKKFNFEIIYTNSHSRKHPEKSVRLEL